MSVNEHLMTMKEQIRCEEDRDYVSSTSAAIEKHLLTIKNLIKKVIDNKDVFEGRFRKLQTFLIASRGQCALSFSRRRHPPLARLEKQQKFQAELSDFSHSTQLNLTTTNIVATLSKYHRAIDELKYQEQLSLNKVRTLEEQLCKVAAEERAQRLKCNFLTKQIQTFNVKAR